MHRVPRYHKSQDILLIYCTLAIRNWPLLRRLSSRKQKPFYVQVVARRFGPMSLRPPDVPALFGPRTFRHWTFRPTFRPWFGPWQIVTYFDYVYFFTWFFLCSIAGDFVHWQIRNKENWYTICRIQILWLIPTLCMNHPANSYIHKYNLNF